MGIGYINESDQQRRAKASKSHSFVCNDCKVKFKKGTIKNWFDEHLTNNMKYSENQIKELFGEKAKGKTAKETKNDADEDKNDAKRKRVIKEEDKKVDTAKTRNNKKKVEEDAKKVDETKSNTRKSARGKK